LNIFFQQVLNGLTLGSVYALVALGLTLVYGILHIPNFAHGALYMVGAYAAFFLGVSLGANYWVAMLGAAVFTAGLAVLCDRLVFHPLRDAPPLHDMIAAIGLLLFLEAGVQAIWGAEFHRLQAPYRSSCMLRARRPAQRLIIIGAAFGPDARAPPLPHAHAPAPPSSPWRRTGTGRLWWHRRDAVSVLTFAISGALAAVAAALFAPINLIYRHGPSRDHEGLRDHHLGRHGRHPGAILGGPW
jgi:branched-chain amino acid transport system permease protein